MKSDSFHIFHIFAQFQVGPLSPHSPAPKTSKKRSFPEKGSVLQTRILKIRSRFHSTPFSNHKISLWD